MTQVLVNLPGGTTLKESAIQGIGPVWVGSNRQGLFGVQHPPYKARGTCTVFLIGGQNITVELGTEDYQDLMDEGDVYKRVEAAAKKKRDAIIKGIWP